MTKTLISYQEHNPCFLRNAAAPYVPIHPVKIVLHLTQNQGRYLRLHIDGNRRRKDDKKNMNGPGAEGLPHIIIGAGNCGKATAFELMPLEWDSDMCGYGGYGTYDSGHTRSIQIAICKDKTNQYGYFRDAVTLAVDICAELCEEFRLANTDVISHREAYGQFMAKKSIQPDWWMEQFGYTMVDFRRWVRLRIDSDEEILPAEHDPVKARYVVARDRDEDGSYVDVLNEYKLEERARRYCPDGFKVYSLTTGKMLYSRKMEPGVKVRVLKNIICGQLRTFKVEHDFYEVSAVEGRRVIISKNGTTVAAVAKENLEILR